MSCMDVVVKQDLFPSHSLEELVCKGLTESWKYCGERRFSEIPYAKLAEC